MKKQNGFDVYAAPKDLAYGQVVVMDCRNPETHCEALYDSCYELWSEIWSATFLDLGEKPITSSDGFTKKGSLCAYIIGGAPVGLIFFDYLDFRRPCHLDDSWLEAWPRPVLMALAEKHDRVLVPSWLTVHPSVRRKVLPSSEVTLSRLLLELLICELMDSRCKIALGTPRKDRKVHLTAMELRAKTLVENVDLHNVLVDLVIFHKASFNYISSEAKALWNRRVDSRKNIQKSLTNPSIIRGEPSHEYDL